MASRDPSIGETMVTVSQSYFLSFFFFFFKILFIYFLERGERKEKERERNINVWLSLTEDLACNPVMCPDWGLNH